MSRIGRPSANERKLSRAETISIEKAAERLGLGVAQVYAAARAGEIPARKIGGRWLVFTVPFDRLLAGDATSE